MSRKLLVLLLVPELAHAGATYTVTRTDLTRPATPPTVTEYFVQNGSVRISAVHATPDYIFKGGAIYVIDNTKRSAQVFTHATLDQVAATEAQAAKRLQDAAAQAPPGQRAMAEKMASATAAAIERQQHLVRPEYQITDRSESVGGHTCRIWEERESGAKRLEFCVAASASVAGERDILDGMKALCQYYQGSLFALGVEFGMTNPWPDIEKWKGVPLLVREFKDGRAVTEITLTAMRQSAVPASLLDVPPDYQIHDRVLR